MSIKRRRNIRNEPCPCGRMKEHLQPISYEHFTQCEDHDAVRAQVTKVPVKYKHCCGDVDNQRKAMKIKRYMQSKFFDMLSKPKETSKLRTVAKKSKSLFRFRGKK